VANLTATACPAPGCDRGDPGPEGTCPDHAHTWIVAAYLPVEADKVVGGEARRATYVKEGTWARVTETLCEACRAPYDRGWGRPCPGADAQWPTGGPEHRQAPIAHPLYKRPPLGATPAPLAPEQGIRNVLRQQRASGAGPRSAPVLLPPRRPPVLLPARRPGVLVLRHRRPVTVLEGT